MSSRGSTTAAWRNDLVARVVEVAGEASTKLTGRETEVLPMGCEVSLIKRPDGGFPRRAVWVGIGPDHGEWPEKVLQHLMVVKGEALVRPGVYALQLLPTGYTRSR